MLSAQASATDRPAATKELTRDRACKSFTELCAHARSSCS